MYLSALRLGLHGSLNNGTAHQSDELLAVRVLLRSGSYKPLLLLVLPLNVSFLLGRLKSLSEAIHVSLKSEKRLHL